MEPITIVIPTLASAERAPYLKRAVASALTQTQVNAIPLVVANGNQGDHDVLRWMERHREIRCLRLESASMPNALYMGWKSVDTRFFGELDDDDELLPQALSIRLKAFENSPELDCVVTNGIVRGDLGDRSGIPDIHSVSADPLRSLMRSNWLLPGSALFRNERLSESVFSGIPEYLEWTYIALRLSLEYTLKFLPEKTVLHHCNLPFSTNLSFAGQKGRAIAMRQLLDLDLPSDVRCALERKAANAYHSVAAQQLENGQTKDAWSWHLKSVLGRGGWHYLAYTRKFFLPG